MSKKRKQESKKARKKRCNLSGSIQRGINMQKALKRDIQRMPKNIEEAVAMGILK